MKLNEKSEIFKIVEDFNSIPEGCTAFFDSGYGGLNVLKAAIDKGLEGNIIYYGDHVHAPYGEKSANEVRQYVEEVFNIFKALKVKAVLIACNTATSVCDKAFLSSYPFFISGSYPPILEAAKVGGKIYVFTTRATYKSQIIKDAYARAREEYPNDNIELYPLDTLAGEIEKNIFHLDRIKIENFFPKGNPDVVVLGCTHYSFLSERIKEYYSCPILDSSIFAADTFLSSILKGNITSNTVKKDVYISDPSEIVNKTSTTNKCLYDILKNRQFLTQKEGNLSIFIIGSQKMVTKTVFKQMFTMV